MSIVAEVWTEHTEVAFMAGQKSYYSIDCLKGFAALDTNMISSPQHTVCGGIVSYPLFWFQLLLPIPYK